MTVEPSQDKFQADPASRAALMRVCALASEAELVDGLAALGALGDVETLRAAETGLVMLRGRMGGVGDPFNVGEAPVTRASVRLATGEIGHGYVLGRLPNKARLAALVDAAGQRGEFRERLEHSLVASVMARVAASEAQALAEREATRVNFFTLVRGEDAR
jgi:alpha-D-ribose 1-methylphosphonate 5-triphosphate synthase subunit PhnG